jgi:PrtD family type I secretion system ABC transporter
VSSNGDQEPERRTSAGTTAGNELLRQRMSRIREPRLPAKDVTAAEIAPPEPTQPIEPATPADRKLYARKATSTPVATTVAAPDVAVQSVTTSDDQVTTEPLTMASTVPLPEPPQTSLRHMPDEVVSRLQNFAATPSLGAVSAPLAPPVALPSPPLERLSKNGELLRALEGSKRALKAVGWQSCAINVLMLTGPIFMLQVYDRVMTSGSIPTLVALSFLTFALYGVIGALEYGRSHLVTRIGLEIDQRIGNRIFEASLRKSLSGGGSAVGALRELDTLRNFAAGPAPMTAFDAAWTPIYLIAIFLTHWTLGVAGTIGAVILLGFAWVSEQQSRGPMLESAKASARSIELAETGQRNAEAIAAMGMLGSYRARWQKVNQEALGWQMLASDRLSTMSAASKTLRLMLQSMMLAIGAWLAVRGDISAGAIIAGTIVYGRALAPVEQIITHWRSSTKAYEAYKKLEALLAAAPPMPEKTALPAPKGNLVVDSLRVAAPETKTLILSNISFDLPPGKMLAVIGPSASGKSTLVRTLVGIWQPFSGSLKLDGIRLDQWNPEDLGQHVGYLPQDVELFAGTVRENIARFRPEATDDEVVAAAQAAHAHELIMGLAKGYESELGAFGTYLSAGQRQRIGLARALFRNPALVVLDEPNANLDRAGDEALASAIDGMRKRGQAVVMVSHRVQAIGKADLLLYIERGIQRAFGPRDEVMKALNGATAPSQPAPQPRRKPDAATATVTATAQPALQAGQGG